ncbi:MAG: hypothetical protein DWH91_15345 [Planctomycetota bacterium]|nr:MAG: hypothetical protein DWH91_15345 [Planctomycetota bacterium]
MSNFIERLGWVLVHSLWQLALLAAGAFVVQWAMRRTSAMARYVVLLGLLGLVVVAPLVTWNWLPKSEPLSPMADAPMIATPRPALVAVPRLEPTAPVLIPIPASTTNASPVAIDAPTPITALQPAIRTQAWSTHVQQAVTPWLSTIVWGWSLGVLAFAVRPLWSWFTVRRLRTTGVSPVPATVQAVLAATAQRLRITQAVQVLQSAIVQVPIVAGYLKPVILLPASIVTGLPASQLEAILAHELAHIRRHDYLANLIQTLVETVFFYHPAVWWLSHQIRCERENCCDDIAVAMLGNRLDYSRALLAVEELRGTPTTLAVGASGGSLLGRVRRLFHRDVEQLRLSNGSITLCGLIGIGLIALAAVASTNHDGSSELFVPGAKAEIDGFGTIEVLGLRFVDSEWWSPDGSNLSASVDLGDPIRDLFNDDPMNGRQIGIVTRFSGVDSPSQSRVRLKSNRTGGHGSVSSMGRRRAEQNQITDIRFCSTNLSPNAVSGELTVLLSFDAWSPWYTIDLKSPEASQNPGPLAPIVGRTPSSLAATQCEIGLQFKSGVHQEIHFEQIALDMAGNEIPPGGAVGNRILGLRHYAVPESQVAKLRYRFQRFTHEVRFRDISLKAGHQTEPQARVQVLHRPERPAAFSEPVTSLASWPQLGGSAAHNPISPVTNLPTQFHLDRQENIRWSQPIGDFAFSSPVVSGGKVLIGTNNAIGRDPRFPKTNDVICLQCFDEATGKFLWQYSSPRMQGLEKDWPLLRICLVPVVEGDRVWLVTNRCEVVCLDLNGHRDNEDDGLPEPEASAPGAESADVAWRYDLVSTLGVRPQRAASVTPTIAGNLLLLNSPSDVDESDQKPATPGAPAFLAIDKMTGELVWSDKTPSSNIHCHGCSGGVPIAPAAALIDGTWQAIFAGYDGWLYAYDLEAIQRGETQLLWKFDLNPKTARLWRERGIATTPVVVGDRVYAAVGNNTDGAVDTSRLWCIDATKRGDLSSELVYNKSAPDVVIPHKQVAVEPDKGDFTRPNPHSGVVWVYNSDDLNQNGKIEHDEQMHHSNSLPAIHDGLLIATDLNGYVHCLDAATGKLLWSHDLWAASPCGPLIADGKVWVIDEDGDLTIFALARQKQILAEHKVEKSGHANLAAANQTLYLATKTQLVAIGSGEFPKPNGVTAKLPGGLEIELVGVTPNAAPTSEGWRADGSLIEGAGHWPRGATFSNDGDRFTITTDGASKLPPNPLARDLLFESRGLRSHPAWVILNQKSLTQFESVNADDTIRRRLSYLPKEPGQPLTVEMALTDSPWGPWQQIDKSGKRINTIETFAPDQKLYEEIQIVRLSALRDTDSSDKPLHLVLVEPATHDDYQSGVFDIEVQFVDKNGKVWKTFARPAPSKDGRRLVTWATGGPVPLESLAYAEFRLRPYRHFITFKNVPLDRTPGAQVAVEHRSLPLPPTHEPDPRFTAQVPGGVEIELLRIVRNDLPEDQSWTPDGKPSPGRLDWPQRSHYKVRPDGNGYSSSNEGPGSDRAWDFAYEVRSAGSKPFVSVDVVGEGSTSSSQFLPAIGPRLVTVIPKDPESLTAFHLRIGTEPWGEWIQVGADGEILNPEAIRTATDAPDRLVTHMRAGLDAENLDRSWLQWRTPQNHNEYYQMEVRAIDDDGKVTESKSSSHSVGDRTHAEITRYFDLPLDRLARFEYRLRPYRHLVRFDQICTDPAKPTEVRVDVTPIVYPEEIPSPEAAVKTTRPLVAKLPGGLEVELVGITKNFAPSKDGWKPDGSPIGEVPDWQATRVFRRVGDSTVFDSKGTPHPDARDYLFEMRGFRSPPSYETNLNDTTSWNEPEYAEPYRTRLSMLLKESNDAKKFSVKVTDDPWGPYQQVGPDGALLNELNLTELEKKYYDKIRVEHCGPDPANPGEGELSLQFQESFILDEKDWGYDFEVRAIGLDGQPLKDAYPWNSSHILNRTTLQYLTSDHLPVDKIARWEYRLRPYRHFIKFENVSFEPGKKAKPKVSVESIEVAKTEEEPVAKSPTPEAQPVQPRIDLIGLTYDSVPKKETWNTNGQPLLAPDWVQQLPKLYGDDKSQLAPLYLFEVHGLRAKPSFRHRYQPAVVSGDDEVPEGRPYRMAVLYEDLKDGQYLWGEHPTVRITDEPWGPWRTITKEGQLEGPLDPGTPYPEGYGQVTAHGLRPLTKKPNDPARAANDPVQLGLVLRAPQGYEYDYAVEIESVPKKAGPLPKPYDELFGRAVSSDQKEGKERWNVEWEWPVDAEKLNHIRFRIRPYRHRFEFQEVAYKQYERPATSAPFKVIHTKLEHDMPKPMDSQTRSLKIQPRVSGQVLQFHSDVNRSRTPPELIQTIDGGVHFILENSPIRINGHLVPTHVELSADRAVIWLPEDEAASRGKDEKNKEDSAFQIYLEGNMHAQMGKDVVTESNAFYNFDGQQGTLFGIEPTMNELRDQPLRARADAVRGNVDGKFSTTEISKKIVATLPGGLELELLGVTPFREPGKESWTPYGKKFDPAPDWAERLKAVLMPPGVIDFSDWANEDYRDFIVRVRGFTPQQRALLPFSGPTIESGDSTIGPMSVLTWNQQVQRLRIGIPGEWGPYRVLTVDPKVPPKAKAVEVPAEVPAPFRKVYDSIQPVIEEGQAQGFAAFDQFPFGEVNLNQGQNKGQHTRVVWKGQPANPDLKYTTIEAVLVDLKGQRHTTTGTTNTQDGQSQWDVNLFDVPFDQVSHVEYRLRPFQHVVTFNNVALHVGAECGPNVVVESPPSPPPYVAKPARPQRPLEAYEKVGVHCQKFQEEVPHGLGGDLMEPTLETPGSESDDGPLVLGLRVAKDPNWRIGSQVRIELTVRNQSKKDVLFTHTGRSDNGLSVVAIDQNGKEHHAYIAQFDSLLVFLPKMLPPFHTTTVKSFLLRFDSEKRDVSDPGVAAFHLPPGDYKLQCRWGDARPEVAHEGEWTGELTSVPHGFSLAAANAAPTVEEPAPGVMLRERNLREDEVESFTLDTLRTYNQSGPTGGK